MFNRERVRPILMAGAIAGLSGLALIGGTRPAAAQYNPYCYYPYYNPYYCPDYGSYSDNYDYGYSPYGGFAFGFGGGGNRGHGGFRGGDFHTGGGGGGHGGGGGGHH